VTKKAQIEEKEEEIAKYLVPSRQLNPKLVRIKNQALKAQVKSAIARQKELKYSQEYN
jgi:hypothetical protein